MLWRAFKALDNGHAMAGIKGTVHAVEGNEGTGNALTGVKG